MLDEMMLHGYNTCIKDMEKLRMAMDKEAEQNNCAPKLYMHVSLLLPSTGWRALM